MKPSVYIETTIVSYLTARPSRDLVIAAHQQITNDWWNDVRPSVKCFVSPFVFDEAARGNKEFARKRIELIGDFELLTVNDEIGELAERYFDALNSLKDPKSIRFILPLRLGTKLIICFRGIVNTSQVQEYKK